jgi:putative DNA primase/helicase
MSDDWTPNDDDAPNAPPKKDSRRKRPKPTLRLVDAAQSDRDDMPAWRRALRVNNQEKLTKDPGNLTAILTNEGDPVPTGYGAWKGTLSFDTFSERVRWTKRPPAMPGFRTPEGEATRADALYVHHYFAKFNHVSFAKHDVWDAMEAAARNNTTHVVRDWLAALPWDGQRRVDTWLTEYFGAEDTPLTRKIGQWWIISAVARAYVPGCQVDHMLVLEGAQGIGKSTGMRILFGTDWYLPKLPNIQDETRAASALRGRWGCEVGELDAFRGAAWTRVKDFLGQSHDDFRAAYAHLEIKRPRHCVFVGTTNDSAYLADPTGARRFWPVRCGLVDRNGLERHREQLWAEARELYLGGLPWHPDRSDRDLATALADAQEERYAADEWENRIAMWINGQTVRDGFTAGDVLSGPLDLRPGDWGKSEQTRVGQALTRLGFERKRRREGGELVYRYWRNDSLRVTVQDGSETP